jgi:hypothetical protein
MEFTSEDLARMEKFNEMSSPDRLKYVLDLLCAVEELETRVSDLEIRLSGRDPIEFVLRKRSEIAKIEVDPSFSGPAGAQGIPIHSEQMHNDMINCLSQKLQTSNLIQTKKKKSMFTFRLR